MYLRMTNVPFRFEGDGLLPLVKPQQLLSVRHWSHMSPQLMSAYTMELNWIRSSSGRMIIYAGLDWVTHLRTAVGYACKCRAASSKSSRHHFRPSIPWALAVTMRFLV